MTESNCIYRIGMMVNDFENEYCQPLINGVYDFCKEHNIECMVFNTRAKKWMYGVYDYQYYVISQYFTKSNLDGLVIISTTQCMFITKEEFSQFLLLHKDIALGSIGVEFNNTASVVVDCKSAFEDVLRHLIRVHNCRRILLMSSTSAAPDILIREQAYKDVLSENFIPYNPSLVMRPTYDLRILSQQLSRYKSIKDIDFDAIACIDDKTAFGCIEYLAGIGVSVPDDVIVTGFDDTITAGMVTPTLTTINQQLYQQGYETASSVFDLISSGKTTMKKNISALPLYRQSCGCVEKNNFIYDACKEDGTYVNLPKSRKLISEMRYLRVKEELNILQYFLQDIQTSMTIPALKRRLKVHLQKFGIKSCVINLFKEPIYNTSEDGCELPDSAYLFLGFNDEKAVFNDSNSIIFNPYDTLVPQNILPRNNDMKITMSLFNTQYLYGYVSFVPDSMDLVLYPIIFSAISAALVSTLSIASTRQEAEILKSEKSFLEEKNDNLAAIARTDELTRLFNRRGLLLYGQQSIEMGLEMGYNGLVIFGDMDGLKKINDDYGHEAGNRAIQAEAILLRKAFRTADIIGRIGGDEFVIIAVSMNMEIFKRVKDNIVMLSDDWNNISGEQFKVSISLGAVPFDVQNYDLNELLDKADKAQYEEKRRKKSASSDAGNINL